MYKILSTKFPQLNQNQKHKKPQKYHNKNLNQLAKHLKFKDSLQ